jgi:YegS/Rv2252/BmrU family lipid kinase
MADRKIIYLINPISGTKGKDTVKQIIRKRTEKERIDFEILETDPAGEYIVFLKKIREEKISDVVVCGGDGTVSAVAAALMGVDVKIGIVPMGSGNGLALAARIPTDTNKALDIIFTGRSRRIDGFYINDRFSCMLCGVGFDAKVAHDFAGQKRRGLQSYIKVAVKNFFTAKPYPFEITTASGTFSSHAFFICIANSNQFGNNFTIAPQASLVDGLIDVVIVKKMNKLALPFSVIAQVTGMNGIQELSDFVDRRNIIYFQTPEVTISNPSEAPLHIDGDPALTSSILSVKVVEKAISLIHQF